MNDTAGPRQLVLLCDGTNNNLGDVYARLASQSYNKALLLDNGNVAIPPKLTVLREMFKPAANAPAASAPAAAKPVAATASGAATH